VVVEVVHITQEQLHQEELEVVVLEQQTQQAQ
jgi:hypothetical protein